MTSVRNLLRRGTLLPSSPNQTLLSFNNSLNLSSVTLQHLPEGGTIILPDGATISYTFFSTLGPTLKSPEVHTPLGSLSGFEYLLLASEVLCNPLHLHSVMFYA